MTVSRIYDVVGGLASHPSATARALAVDLELAVQRDASRLPRLVRLAAAWAAANWRDPHARHPHLLTYRALDALGI